MSDAPGRYWIIRHPQSQGSIVAKFDTAGATQIDEGVANYDDFVIQEVSDRSALADKEIEQSELSDSEKELLSQVYPTGQS